MTALAGNMANVLVASGAGVTFTNEATTDIGDGVTFQIDDTDRRYWDPTAAVVVERDTGSGWGVVAASEYEVQHVGGRVIFDSDQTGNDVRVDGKYLVFAQAAHGKEWSADTERDIMEANEFQSEWKVKVPGLLNGSAEVSAWYPDGGSEFMALIAAGALTVLVLYPEYTDGVADVRFEGFANLSQDSVSAAIDSVVEEALSFEITGEMYRAS